MMSEHMTETCPKLREAIENGHLRCSVSVGVGSPVATIDTEDLWRLVHAAERSLSTSAAERGMREALERIARQTLSVDMSVDDHLGGDFEGAYNYMIEDARAALSGIEGEDEQARGQGRSAPISTDTKGTSK
jgi:MoaA/NifB/PqqE/SkfB family radical SAM enzyme